MTASIVLSWKWRKWDSNALQDYYHQSVNLLYADTYSWKGIMDYYDSLYWAELKQYWFTGFPFVVTVMTYQYQWIMLEYGKADSIRSYFWISSVLEVRTSWSRGFVFRPRVNLIHNQTLRRPSRGKERSDSARPDYKPSKNFVSRVVNCSAAYRHIRSYTRSGEYSKYHCGIVGEILAGYHSVAGIISGVNYMLDYIGMANDSTYYRVSWTWSYVRLRNRLRL